MQSLRDDHKVAIERVRHLEASLMQVSRDLDMGATESAQKLAELKEWVARAVENPPSGLPADDIEPPTEPWVPDDFVQSLDDVDWGNHGKEER